MTTTPAFGSYGPGLDAQPVPLLFVDLDDTIRHGFDTLGRFVNGPDDVGIFPEAITMMGRWREAGGRVVGVSNQGGIALGRVDREQVSAAMARTYELAENLIEMLAWCSHHPAAPDPMWRDCWCRKPMPGLLIGAWALLLNRYPNEHYPRSMMMMVGDRAEDFGAAAAAGIKFQWAREWRAEA